MSMVVRCVFPRYQVFTILFFIFLILLISSAPEICSLWLPTSLIKLRARLVETIASANVLWNLSASLDVHFPTRVEGLIICLAWSITLELALAFDYPDLFWWVVFILILAIMLRLQLRQIQTNQDQDIGFLARNVRSQWGVVKSAFFAILVTFGFTFVVLEWMTIYITRSPLQMKTGPVLGVSFPTTSPTRLWNQRLRSKTAPMWPAYIHPLLLMFELEFL